MIKKQLLTAVAVLAIGISAQAAAFINGTGNFFLFTPPNLNINNDFDTTSLATASQVDPSTVALVTGTTGDFTPANLQFVGIPGYTFNPSGYISQYFNNLVGFYADIIEWTSLSQSSTSLSLVGSAVFYGNGYQPTAGQISISYSKVEISDNVSYSGTFAAFGSEAQLPDAGGTVALLGIAVIGFAMLPRRKTA